MRIPIRPSCSDLLITLNPAWFYDLAFLSESGFPDRRWAIPLRAACAGCFALSLLSFFGGGYWTAATFRWNIESAHIIWDNAYEGYWLVCIMMEDVGHRHYSSRYLTGFMTLEYARGLENLDLVMPMSQFL